MGFQLYLAVCHSQIKLYQEHFMLIAIMIMIKISFLMLSISLCGLCSSFREMTENGLHPALLATLCVSGMKVTRPPLKLNKWIQKNRILVLMCRIEKNAPSCCGQVLYSLRHKFYQKGSSRHWNHIPVIYTRTPPTASIQSKLIVVMICILTCYVGMQLVE